MITIPPLSYKNKRKSHYVYKYVFDGKIVYIGKNDTNLINRIYQHTLEPKFRECKEAEIYYAELGNSTESTVMEMLLINKYKPRLNVTFVQDGLSIDFQEPEWIKYDAKDFKNYFDAKAGLSDRSRSPDSDCVPAWLEDSHPVFSKKYEWATSKVLHGTCRICGAISENIVGIDWVAGYSDSPTSSYEKEHWSYRPFSIELESDVNRNLHTVEQGEEKRVYGGSSIHAIACCPSCYSAYLKPLVDGLMRIEKLKVPVRAEYAEETATTLRDSEEGIKYIRGLFDKQPRVLEGLRV